MHIEISPVLNSRNLSFDLLTPYIEKQDFSLSFVIFIQNFEQNLKMTEKEAAMYNVWKWLSHYKISEKYEGVFQIIEKTESACVEKDFQTLYTSAERSKALEICDWDIPEIPQQLSVNSKDPAYQKEMMKYVMFNLFSFKYAEVLQVIPESSVLYPIIQNIQSNQAESHLQEFYKKLAKHENDTFLKNCLLFLSGPSNYRKILDSFSMLDSAGFALRFLNDSDLKLHLTDLIKIGMTEGNPQTLILSGFNLQTPTLLSKFNDNSNDFESVGILSILYLRFGESEILEKFVKNFKDQLNISELYHARCMIEIEECKLLNKKKEKGKSILCYYCQKSITIGNISGNHSFARREDPLCTSMPFLNRCPNCEKQLPKCAVCLYHMKSINPLFVPDKSRSDDKIVELFTWCEECRHGGHTSHILEWFTDTNDCPVYGCECKCNNLDKL